MAPPVILGSRALQEAYDHPHASEMARRIAEQGTALRAPDRAWVDAGLHRSYLSFWAGLER